MGKGKKTPAWETRAKLDAAIDDIRHHGRIGRSLPQIAAAHGVSLGSLNHRIKVAREDGFDFGENWPGEAGGSVAVAVPECLNVNGESSLSVKAGENKGNEGVRLLSSGGGPSALSKPATAAEIELERLNREVGRIVDSSIRLAGGLVQCKTPADLARLYELRRATLGLSSKAEGSKPGPLLQVQILSQTVANRGQSSPAIEVKAARIMESGNESGSDSAQS